MSKQITNHLVEIRFKPNPRFLDNRGFIADQIVENSVFNHWIISENRIDFSSNKNLGLSAFFSFRNLGVTSNYPATKKEFLNITEEYIKSVWEHFITNSIVRIGVRSVYLIESENLTKTFNMYKSKFLKLSDNDIKKFGGELVDVGFPLNFVDGKNFFNIMTGPMEKKQSKNIFGDNAFESGIYLEVDYFKEEISPHIIQKHTIQFVQNGIKKANSIAEQITEWVNT